MDHSVWRVWKEDKTKVSERLKKGKELEAYVSAFGDNDLSTPVIIEPAY